MEGIGPYDATLEMGFSSVRPNTVEAIDTAITLLGIMSGLNLLDTFMGLPGGIYQIGINMFLAYYLKQMKSWARTAVLVRAVTGVVANFFLLGLHDSISERMPALTIVFLIYATFPVLLSAILLNKDVKMAFQNRKKS